MSAPDKADTSCRGKDARQIAALPVRFDARGKLRVLMVTSRDTGRWVMPKGWLMEGKAPWDAAEIEALEEAGATGHISQKPIGTYCYAKRLEDETSLPCKVTVYPMAVSNLEDDWKERDERRRDWFSPKKAAALVHEKDLSEILLKVANDPDHVSFMKDLREAS